VSKILAEDRQRLHQQVRDRIRNMLIRGGSRTGDALPTYRELSHRMKVSLVTVQRAMDELLEEGVVRGWPGKGTFLARELSPEGRRLTQIGLVYYGSRRLFFSSDYLMEIFQGILMAAEDASADVRIFSIKNEGRVGVREIEESGVDGLLLLGVANEEYLAELARELLPMIVVDYRTNRVPCDCLVVDNEQAAERIVQHLARLGHRRIAYLDGFSTDPLQAGDPVIETSDVRERREGYRTAMERLGLADHVQVFGVAPGKPEAGIAAAAESVALRSGAPTAVVAYDTTLARQLCEELRRRGLGVPGQCSMAAMAGAGDAQIGALTCTFNRVRFAEMGRRAVELLAQRCRNGKPAEAVATLIETDFVLGNTCAPPA
jgi:GntR family transcriptional regulator of arabinose operon